MSKKKRPIDYEVGYGKPPAERQFQKGRSGNPNGRPRKKNPVVLSDGAILREILETEVPINGREETATMRKLLLLSLVNSHIKKPHPNPKYVLEILRRAEEDRIIDVQKDQVVFDFKAKIEDLAAKMRQQQLENGYADE